MFRLIFLTLVFLISASLHASEAGLVNFKNGVNHFKNKQYKSALVSFQKASKAGMNKTTLHFNYAVTYYKLKQYKNAEKSFQRILKDKNLRQIGCFNLGLIAEKQKQEKTAVDWYNKAVNFNRDKKLTQLANNKLNKLLKRKKTTTNKTFAGINLAFGKDDNITSAASNSPSNNSDNNLELFAYLKTPMSENTNFKGNFYILNYSEISTENFDFYSLAIEHIIKLNRWKIVPEFSFTQSHYNNTAYQNVFDLKVNGKYTFRDKSRLNLRYRSSNINSQNTLYNYLKGQRHQFRADYKNKIYIGRLRLRYQLEINNRQNSIAANYSPTRHTFRTRLKHKLAENWTLSEEIGYRTSQYDSAAGITRNDSRFRFRVTGSNKINKNWSAGIRYIYTDNNSNIASEKYTRTKIQLFTNWIF